MVKREQTCFLTSEECVRAPTHVDTSTRGECSIRPPAPPRPRVWRRHRCSPRVAASGWRGSNRGLAPYATAPARATLVLVGRGAVSGHLRLESVRWTVGVRVLQATSSLLP